LENSLTTVIENLLPKEVTLRIAPIAAETYNIHPSELDSILPTTPRRIQEFSAGRYCAHAALREHGVEDFAVIRGDNREPIWPDQQVGSIAHCRDLAGAIVADKSKLKSIGLDIENHRPIKFAICRHICTEREIDWLTRQEPSQQIRLLQLIFSIKEAVFKCVFQASGIKLRFRECTLEFLEPSLETRVEIKHTGLALRHGEITICHSQDDAHLFSVAFWHHRPAVG
jgi:4'-phosphopantetheinyl transferase EntD